MPSLAIIKTRYFTLVLILGIIIIGIIYHTLRYSSAPDESHYDDGQFERRDYYNVSPLVHVQKYAQHLTRPDENHNILNSRSTGYVLALSYKDQLTSSSHRLVALQCWEKQWNMFVVSPFVDGTFFRGPLHKDLTTTAMKYGDIFNISKWNRYCEEFFLPPFVPWKDFLQNAPRNVVLVDIVYNRYVEKACAKTDFNGKKCDFHLLGEFWSHMLQPHQFKIVKRVCIDLNMHLDHHVTMEKLNTLFWGDYSEYSPRSVSLVMNEWRGIAPSLRRKIERTDLMECHIHINTDDCLSFTHKNADMVFKLLSPNSQLFHDADMYVSKHLSQSNGYIAVMVRWEWIGNQRVNDNDVVKYVKTWKKQENVTDVFLTTDVGNVALSKKPSLPHLIEHTKKLFSMLYGKQISLEDYSKTFEDISNSTHPGYLSQLQRVIAAKARCLLMVGGGHFQQQTLNLYNELHVDEKMQCHKYL